MTIYIASEIVGATTLVYHRDSDMGARESPYPRTVQIATDESNAIVSGALEAGGTCYLVNEFHKGGEL